MLFSLVFILLLNVMGSSRFLAQEVEPAVAAGGSHSVLLMRDGTVWSWGANADGQLGNGTTEASMTPVRVEGLTGVKSVAAGDHHTVALKSDGTVWTWGKNHRGQLGNGSTVANSPLPVQAGVEGDYLTGVTAIAAGVEHTVALKSDGTVWAWGNNLYGQLGDGTKTRQRSPVQVQGLAGNVIALAAGGYHTVALLQDNGTVWSWGYNFNGQLGDGTKINRNLPGTVVAFAGSDDPLQGMVSVAAGNMHTLALGADGKVRAWGANGSGQLGDGGAFEKTAPIEVVLLDNVVLINSGGDFSLAVKDDRTMWAWGHNDLGQLGDGTTITRHYNTQVVAPSGEGHIENITGVSGGALHTLALQAGGTVWAWGYNINGQLGDNSSVSAERPVQVLMPAPPEILSEMPGDGDVDVSTGAAVELVFNENIREGITYDAVTIRDGGDNPLAVNISITGSVLRLEPAAALDYSTVYTVIIPRWAVQGMAGNLLAADFSYSFTTERAPDHAPPVISLFTINGGAALASNREVLLQIEATDDTTDQAELQLRFSNDSESWSEWEAYTSEKDWTLLEGDGEKTVYIEVKDEAEKVAATEAGITLDTTPPFVMATVPINGATDIPGDQPLEVTIAFSEVIEAAPQFDNITLKDVAGIPIGLVKHIFNESLYLQTTADLLNNNTYTVSLPAESLQDEAANGLAGEFQLIFQTTIVEISDPDPGSDPDPVPDPDPDPVPDPDPGSDPDPLPPSWTEAEAANIDKFEDNLALAGSGILASAADVYAFPIGGTMIGSHFFVEADAAILMEAVEQTLQSGKNKLALVVIGGEEADLADLIEITLPFDSLQLLVTAGLNLFLCMSPVELAMPAETLASLGQEQGLSITVAAVKDRQHQLQLAEQGRELLLQSSPYGEPLHITTSFDGPARVVFPLPESSKPILQVEQLYIYVEHSDGEMVLLHGEPYYDATGALVGIGDWVDRFSIFALLESHYKKVLSLQPGSTEALIKGGHTVLDVPPFIHYESASLMAPVRFLGETLGGRVCFLPLENKIIINKNNQQISLVLGSSILFVNGEATVLPCPVSVVEGRAFAPARLFSNALGADVHWNGKERKVIVREKW